MTNLRQKLIYVDEDEWQLLGEKVGKNQRSSWIRDRIHEEVGIPDELDDINKQIEETNKEREILEKRKGEILQSKQIVIEKHGEENERLNNALEMVNERAEESKRKDGFGGYDISYTISKDELINISETYAIDYNTLSKKVEKGLGIKILKYRAEPNMEKEIDPLKRH